MIESRVTLATIDAAATDALSASPSTTFGTEQLGIGQTVDGGTWSKNYGCGDDWACKRSHPDFIDPGNGGHSPAPQLPLESKTRPYTHLLRPACNPHKTDPLVA